MCDRKGCKEIFIEGTLETESGFYRLCKSCTDEILSLLNDDNLSTLMKKLLWDTFVKFDRRFNVSFEDFINIRHRYILNTMMKHDIKNRFSWVYVENFNNCILEYSKIHFQFTDIILHKAKESFITIGTNLTDDLLIFSIVIKYCSDPAIEQPFKYYLTNDHNYELRAIFNQKTTVLETRIPIQSLIDAYRR